MAITHQMWHSQYSSFDTDAENILCVADTCLHCIRETRTGAWSTSYSSFRNRVQTACKDKEKYTLRTLQLYLHIKENRIRSQFRIAAHTFACTSDQFLLEIVPELHPKNADVSISPTEVSSENSDKTLFEETLV